MGSLTLGIIGCGNMGSAIVKGLIKKSILPSASILLYDKEIDKMRGLAAETGCLSADISGIISKTDIILLAVKPQNFDEICGVLAEGSAIEKRTIISVMAGIRIAAINRKLGDKIPVARAMPNMAAFVGESITGVSYNDFVSRRGSIESIFSSIGKVIVVEEKLMDGVTAVSGSGPAYFFYLAECMIDAAEKAGFGQDTARELVLQTMYGASLLMRSSDCSPGELIKKVASRGGTTEAALSVMDNNGMKKIILDAIDMAKKRSEELSGG
ncbi:MAG: pyrroline-5-carboxylate reductase [Candidatus Omnitrophota bacterium]